MFTSILLTILVFPHGESLASQGDDNTDFVQTSALASNKELGGEVVDAAGLKPQQQHHHQAHKRSKQSKKKADSSRTGARIVMGGGETRCKPEFQITDQSDCNAAAGLLSGITIRDDDSAIDVSTSDEVSDQHIPTGCSYVPMSGSDHRRRQVRWNTHEKNKRNHDVGPLCDTSGLSGDQDVVEGKGSVCRINADGQGEGTNGDGATCGGATSTPGCVGCNATAPANGEAKWCPSGMTMESCEQSCRDVIANGGNCYGYEFKSTDGRCEIWPSPIAWQKPSSGTHGRPSRNTWTCNRVV